MKNKPWIKACVILAAGALLLLCICSVCFMSMFAFMADRGADKLAEAQVVRNLCGLQNSELFNFYHNSFTADYKSRVSYVEFKNLHNNNQDIFVNCENEFANFEFSDLLKGSSMSYSRKNDRESLDFKTKINDKNVKISLVEEGDDWLIDDLVIQ